MDNTLRCCLVEGATCRGDNRSASNDRCADSKTSLYRSHLCTVPIFVSVLFVAADVNVHNIFHDHVEFKRALEWLRGQSEHLPGSCTGCGTFSKFHARQMGKYRIARPWLDYTVAEFWHYLHCDSIMGVARPIHNESTWMVLKGTYQGVVGPALSS